MAEFGLEGVFILSPAYFSHACEVIWIIAKVARRSLGTLVASIGLGR
jgi:hypothetical protein